MIEIFNRDRSRRLGRGRNLRIVRERAARIGAAEAHIVKTPTGAQLTIRFSDGSYTVIQFADYRVLCGILRRWRSLHGAQLWGRYNGNPILCGWVAPRNVFLVNAVIPA